MGVSLFEDDFILFCCSQVWKTNNKWSKHNTEGKERGGYSYFAAEHSVASLTFNLLFFVSQSHSYVNLANLNLTAESVSQSEVASIVDDSPLSPSKADSLSSQMARLSKYLLSLKMHLLCI